MYYNSYGYNNCHFLYNILASIHFSKSGAYICKIKYVVQKQSLLLTEEVLQEFPFTIAI